MSGRCGTGSFDFAGGLDRRRQRRQLQRRRLLFLPLFFFFFPPSRRPSPGAFLARLLLRRRLLRLRRQDGHFAADGDAARRQVVLAAKTLRRGGGQAFCRGAAGRRPWPHGPAPPARHECLQRRLLLVGEAGQRRPLPLDTRTLADIHQLLVVDLQLFGERVDADGQLGSPHAARLEGGRIVNAANPCLPAPFPRG